MIKKELVQILTLFLLVFSLTQIGYSGDKVRLTLVWARVADFNGEAGSVESAEFSPDSRTIIAGTKFDNQLVLFRTSDGTELWRAEVGEEIERAGFSPDGKWVVSVGEDRLISLFRAEDGHLEWTFPLSQGIDALAFSPDGQWMAAGEEVSPDHKARVRVFKMPERELAKTLIHSATVNDIDFTADGKYMLSAGGDNVQVWDTSNWSLFKKLYSDNTRMVTAQFHPSGEYIAGSGVGGLIHIWDVDSAKIAVKFNHTGQKTETVDWTPDGNYLATHGNDFYFRIYRTFDIFNRKDIPIAFQSEFTDAAEYLDFNDTGSLLVSAHQDGLVRLWVFMSDDPDVNSKRHNWVLERQRKAFHEDQ